MWFKQIQVFEIKGNIFSPEKLAESLQALAFSPCLPSMHQSIGWVSPIDEEGAPLIRTINSCMMICLQIEEKILPATVVQQTVSDTVKKIETSEGRRVRAKEKNSLKDEITVTLLPRAFTKFTKIYAYIDTKNHWLILGTTNAKKTESFFSLLKKSISDEMNAVVINKLSMTMTHWLKHQSYPASFSIEKACVLQDPAQENRVIRCKQQDLFATGIQSLIKDGCEAIQLALCWQDRVTFVLNHHFLLTNIQFQDELIAQMNEMDAETKQQQFDADFLIMTETFSQLLLELRQALSNDNVVELKNNLKHA